MQKNQIRKILFTEYYLHPQATLIDYYKLFYQSYFGPAHFIKDKQAAFNFLKKEYAEMKDFELHLMQKIGYKNKFYRVNLALIKKGWVNPEEFFAAFYRSTLLKTEISKQRWQSIWVKIEKLIVKEINNLPDYKNHSSLIKSKLSEGQSLFSHSKVYHDLYHPHYRIICYQELQELYQTSENNFHKI